MLGYVLIVLSTVLFGGQFIALDAYQKGNGKTNRAVLFFLSFFALIGTFLFACLSGFQISFSLYTTLYAGIAAIIQISLQFFGIKALSRGRVEVYSLFNVAGGMSVAYFFGITYFNEPVKPLHIIGVVLILLALVVPIISDKQEHKKSDWLFYLLCVLVFLANGFFGVINKIHINSGEGLSIKEYLFYVYLFIFLLSFIPLCFSFLFKDKKTKSLFNTKGFIFAIAYGLLNSVGMFLQYDFADQIPATVLFPLSNGGCIVFSLLIGCLFYRRKPKISDIIQIAIATIGMSLFLIL